MFIFVENGVRLTTFTSQKRGRNGVAWTALRGGACKRALSVMGDAFAASEGVFKHDKKDYFALIWRKTNE